MNISKGLSKVIAIGLMLLSTPVLAQDDIYINLEHIAKIESGHKANAFNWVSGARGMYQITDICLLDFNRLNKEHYTGQDMFDPQLSGKVANWYLNTRIPALLKAYRVPDGVDRRLWVYNAGIGAVISNRVPRETRDYIKKYHSLD